MIDHVALRALVGRLDLEGPETCSIMIDVDLANRLRQFISTDPGWREPKNSLRTFRVNDLAALCQVDADIVRLWALGTAEIPVTKRPQLLAAIPAPAPRY